MSTLAHVLAESVPIAAGPKSLGEVITNLRNWIMGLSALLATLFLTYGGLLYLTAGGDPEGVNKAKRAFRNSAIGFAVMVLAPIITAALEQIVGKPR